MRIFIMVSVVYAIITYDSNTFTKFAYQYSGGSSCFSPAQKEQTIYFSDTFARPPKIILQPEMMDIIHTKVNYTFQITAITTQSFILQLQCYYSIVYGVVFRWQAIVDERIQIINEFNMDFFQNKTYPHNNSNAEKAIISLINLSFQGPIYFDILIDKITKTNVSVVITNPNNTLSNLLMLGYQVILGTEEAISILNSIKTTAVYTSPLYNIQDKSWFITSLVGFSYNVFDNIRINKTYYLDQYTIKYSIFSLGNVYYAPQTHYATWIKYQFTNIYTALECRTIRITQITEKLAEFRNSFEVEIMETNQVLNTLGTSNIIIDKSYQLINLNVYARCFKQKKIQSYFNKCKGCLPQKQHQFSHNCYGAINTINFSVKLFPAIQAHQELIIILSNLDCQIYQILFNQEMSQVKLIEIKQLDIQHKIYTYLIIFQVLKLQIVDKNIIKSLRQTLIMFEFSFYDILQSIIISKFLKYFKIIKQHLNNHITRFQFLKSN